MKVAPHKVSGRVVYTSTSPPVTAAATALRPEFMCRVRWQRGTLLLWNNPLVLHTAIDDYRGYRRVTYRTTVEGWTQVPAQAAD